LLELELAWGDPGSAHSGDLRVSQVVERSIVGDSAGRHERHVWKDGSEGVDQCQTTKLLGWEDLDLSESSGANVSNLGGGDRARQEGNSQLVAACRDQWIECRRYQKSGTCFNDSVGNLAGHDRPSADRKRLLSDCRTNGFESAVGPYGDFQRADAGLAKCSGELWRHGRLGYFDDSDDRLLAELGSRPHAKRRIVLHRSNDTSDSPSIVGCAARPGAASCLVGPGPSPIV